MQAHPVFLWTSLIKKNAAFMSKKIRQLFKKCIIVNVIIKLNTLLRQLLW